MYTHHDYQLVFETTYSKTILIGFTFDLYRFQNSQFTGADNVGVICDGLHTSK